MEDQKRLEKNKRIAESIAATRAKRKSQECRVRTLKIQTNKLSKSQAEALSMAFTEAKWLRNHLLAAGIPSGNPPTTVTVLTKDGTSEARKLTHLGVHLRQAVLAELEQNRKALAALKKNGRSIGKLNFVSQVTSINLKEFGNTYRFNEKRSQVKVQKLGWLPVRGSHQLEGFELANAKLLKRPDGFYLAVTCYQEKQDEDYKPGTLVGLDMGVKTHITFSDGRELNLLVGETERLKRLQRKLQRQQKGSNSRRKTLEKLQREYQRMDWRKDDAANKLVHQLLEHELVFLQDENLAAWRVKSKHHRNGKRLQHSILGRVKVKLLRSERVVVLRKNAPTTQECPCGAKNKFPLDERTYFCTSCGYRAPRDAHAAQNMIRMGWKQVPVEHRDVKPVEFLSDWGANLLACQQRTVKPEVC